MRLCPESRLSAVYRWVNGTESRLSAVRIVGVEGVVVGGVGSGGIFRFRVF